MSQQEVHRFDEQRTKFLTQLTALSHETGVGLADDARIFILDPEDATRYYSYDNNGRLQFVLPEQDQQRRTR